MALEIAQQLGSALRNVAGYVARNPGTLFTLARHAAGLRVAVPLDAIRWGISEFLQGGSGPSDIRIEARQPAIHVGATITIMGTTLSSASSIEVTELRVGSDELLMTLQVRDVDLQVIGDSPSPLAKMIASGAFDLKNPANLMRFIPKKPPMLVEASGDTFVLDLMKLPQLGTNPAIMRVLRTVTPVLTVSTLGTEGDYLVVGLRATPTGIRESISAVRG